MPQYRLPDDWQVQRVTTALSESYDWSLQFLGIEPLWKETQGAGVKVAILDTGVDESHPDLQGAIVATKDFTRSIFGVNDRVSHGTWCAGCVGARQGNDTGVAGIAPKADLIIGKVLGDNGGGDERAIAAGVEWALSEGADILSLSLGGPQMSSQMRGLLQKFTKESGKYIIAAAGNDGHANNRDTVNYPARWTECLCVGAVDKKGNITQFSSNGPRVDIFAPGYQMLSTIPDGYGLMSGTSMATPCVAGVVALCLAKKRITKEPMYSVSALRERLQHTATRIGDVGLISPAQLFDGIGTTPTVPSKYEFKVPGGTIVFTPDPK